MEEITFIGEGRYSADRDGHIYDSQRKMFVAECPIKTGYLIVHLRDKGKSRVFTVHRIIGRVFCAGFKEGLDINHINGNKKDNRSDNLEWVTRSENILHAYRTGLRESSKGKPKNSLALGVIRVSADGTEKAYRTLQEASEDTGASHQNISKVLCGRRTCAAGYKWRRP